MSARYAVLVDIAMNGGDDGADAVQVHVTADNEPAAMAQAEAVCAREYGAANVLGAWQATVAA